MISLLTTLYRSERSLGEFYARASRTLADTGEEYEMILVNDGSPDGSLAAALALRERDPRVVVVDLSKNFGQHRALLTGLEQARGAQVFWIESDLEERPEWLPLFRDALRKDPELDVVFGQQRKRKGGIGERVSGWLFYRLFNLFSEVQMPPDHITCRLMTRRYAEALLSFGDRELFLGGIYEAVGFKQAPFIVEKLSLSPTTYSFRRKLSLVVDATTSFSYWPLAAIFFLGVGMAFFAGTNLAWLEARNFLGVAPPGWAIVACSVWLVGGLTLASLGVVGVYVKKALGEAKRRPLAVVRRVYRS